MTDLIPSRESTIQRFKDATSIPTFRRLIQRGRERDTAEYFMELDDGHTIRLGGIDQLWSQTEFAKTIAVTTGHVPKPLKVGEWRNSISALFWVATDVEDPPEESAVADAEEILAMYLPATPNLDRDHACTGRLPWAAEDGTTHIHPRHLQQFIGRELGERQTLRQVRTLLRNLGYKPQRVDYQRDGEAGDEVRTTTIYYTSRNGAHPDHAA